MLIGTVVLSPSIPKRIDAVGLALSTAPGQYCRWSRCLDQRNRKDVAVAVSTQPRELIRHRETVEQASLLAAERCLVRPAVANRLPTSTPRYLTGSLQGENQGSGGVYLRRLAGLWVALVINLPSHSRCSTEFRNCGSFGTVKHIRFERNAALGRKFVQLLALHRPKSSYLALDSKVSQDRPCSESSGTGTMGALLVEGWGTAGVLLGRARDHLLAEQPFFWQRLLSFDRPQRCIRAARELLAQTRWPVEGKQALTAFVYAGCGPW